MPRSREDRACRSAARYHEEGLVLSVAKDYRKAEKMFRQANDQFEESLGWSDPRTLMSRHRLGTVLLQRKKYDEAEKMLQHVVQSRETLLGKENVDTLISRHSLGRTFRGRNEYREAGELFIQCVEGFENTLGKDSAWALSSRHYLGSTAFEQGLYDSAEKQFQQIVQAREIRCGKNAGRTLEAKYWLGRTLYRLEEFDKAYVVFQDIVRNNEKAQGKSPRCTRDSKFWLGNTYYQLKRYRAAEELLRAVVKEYENKSDRYLHRGRHCLGRTIFQLGQYAEAETLLRDAAKEYMKVDGKQSSNMLKNQHWLGLTLYQMGKTSEAQVQLYEAVEGLRELYGEGNKEFLESKAWLDRALSGGESPMKVKRPYEQVEEERQGALSDENLDALPLADAVPDVSSGYRPSASNDAQSEFGSRLTAFFLDRDTGNKPYTDDEISQISMLLGNSSPQWSTSPRTYIILRSLNQLHVLNDLLHLGFSDYWLPTTERSLPTILPQHIRASFVNIQHLVLTKSACVERGTHCHFTAGETLPFTSAGVLGAGTFGLVDKVGSTVTSKCYARKRVLRSAVFRGPKKEHTRQFIAEIEILKRLHHRHIVELVGSYTDTKYIGLLMLPIASQDLSVYLQTVTASSYPELRSFFGCLTSALEYLHAEKIRHKDIKPSNILVDSGNVLFVDFGLSLDYEDKTGSTTTGMVNGRTPRYCAPEVAALEPRNTKSDIWSLGVVFLEMVTVLKGVKVEEIKDYFEAHGTGQPFVRTNMEALSEFMAELEHAGHADDNKALAWIGRMLAVEQRTRPTASSLLVWIQTDSGEEGVRFCGACCEPAEEVFSDLEE